MNITPSKQSRTDDMLGMIEDIFYTTLATAKTQLEANGEYLTTKELKDIAQIADGIKVSLQRDAGLDEIQSIVAQIEERYGVETAGFLDAVEAEGFIQDTEILTK